MKANNKRLLLKSFSIISEDISLPQARAKLKTVLAARKDLTAREKNILYNEFIRLYNIGDYNYLKNLGTIRRVMSMMSRIERQADVRVKKNSLSEQMSDNRAKSLPVIFYFCSYHEKPAKDHKDYQSKIYVDKFWKSTISSRPELTWLIEPIRAYIRNHKILTVQDVTQKPPYLIYRPYCKHFLVPIDTWSVLTSSLSSIKRQHPEAIQGTGVKSKNQYAKDKVMLQNRIVAAIEANIQIKIS